MANQLRETDQEERKKSLSRTKSTAHHAIGAGVAATMFSFDCYYRWCLIVAYQEWMNPTESFIPDSHVDIRTSSLPSFLFLPEYRFLNVACISALCRMWHGGHLYQQ
mmetsp:Transcript_24171/g.67011  ORF Transcript_24171/g.67011 Transcript_24171/m.67011 type:complete len:107 (+) Transcript_24171:1068-1388(+)